MAVLVPTRTVALYLIIHILALLGQATTIMILEEHPAHFARHILTLHMFDAILEELQICAS